MGYDRTEMIETIRGTITDIRDGCVIVETSGIGYRVYVTPILAADVEVGKEIILHTSYLTREERQYLYGFRSRIERELFDVLLTVSGIGAKTALALLGLQADQVISSIAVGDERVLKTIPGIGTKTAKRVILELRDKLGKEFIGQLEAIASLEGLGDIDGTFKPAGIPLDALEALENLGYNRTEALQRIHLAKTELGDEAKLEEIIRVALKAGE